MDNNRVKYVTDEHNGVVVAEIAGCYSDAQEMMNTKFIPCVTSGMTIYNRMTSKFDMNRKYKAVAKLHPEDEWNEQRGKAIACDRLTETYHNSLNKRLAKYAEDFRKIADNIEQYLNERHFYDNN